MSVQGLQRKMNHARKIGMLGVRERGMTALNTSQGLVDITCEQRCEGSQESEVFKILKKESREQ